MTDAEKQEPTWRVEPSVSRRGAWDVIAPAPRRKVYMMATESEAKWLCRDLATLEAAVTRYKGLAERAVERFEFDVGEDDGSAAKWLADYTAATVAAGPSPDSAPQPQPPPRHA